MELNKLIDLILYGDIHETPLSILDGDFSEARLETFDIEQMVRLSMAATIKQLVNQGKLKIS